MLVGFIHGVMNTDNMAISGETIDYGPCAFMDAFDPATVYSSIDETGRYAYANQPLIAEWNLARLAEALLPLLDEDEERAVEKAQESLGAFRRQYSAAWTAGMKAKLGLGGVADDVASAVIDEVLGLLREARVDYTSFFRRLARTARGSGGTARDLFPEPAAFDDWAARWQALNPDADAMGRVNPAYVPRNHIVEEALQAATGGDLGPLSRLLEVVTDPYNERPGVERYAEAAPESFGPYRTFCGT
jgi:uncharacterized protein YdiU (UPF0061 family)